MAATLPDATTNKWYQQYIQEFTPQQIDYKDITTERRSGLYRKRNKKWWFWRLWHRDYQKQEVAT